MDSALFIGRFQPFHNGHLDVIKKILTQHDRVIIVIGSAEKNYLKKNPLTAGERLQLIEEALYEAKIPPQKFLIIPVCDINDFDHWVDHLNTYIPPYNEIFTGSQIVKDCFKNHQIKIINVKRDLPIRATDIRAKILHNEKWEDLVPKTVEKKLKEWNFHKRLQSIK